METLQVPPGEHRFSTVGLLDRSVILEGGAIREKATRDQLIRHG
jgi:hypothetical protein